ncbi:MAG: grasp-with-spasm system SPASM domain peptide maturase [Bacteroidetes bacterium]|nr:grasp-with-spasm system SPASM domain peptide maturase [Bacteroidota bacterium]MBK9300371.1 grasp-with-spasm system SPASM domain peptide maturase [Bacteroidota bacterium]
MLFLLDLTNQFHGGLIMISEAKKYFTLYGNVQIVDGFERCLIVDTYREKFFLIPKSLSRFLKRHKNRLVQDVYKMYSQIESQIVDEYFIFLKDNDLIHFSINRDHIKNFISMPLTFAHYGAIINSIIELNSFENFETICSFIFDLNAINCSHLQIIFQSKLTKSELDFIANKFDNTEFRSIEIYFEYTKSNADFEWQEFFIKFKRISLIIMFCSPDDKILYFLDGHCIVNYLVQPSGKPISCGRVSTAYFQANTSLFTESQHHNTCLNRKISIDINGDIKNCPSMAKSYGNIRDTKLIDVVNNPEFQKVWHIKKDEIAKCKDCEFRHICTDCRAYIENPEDQYSAPLKCGYNPYTCEWEEWSTNPLKQQAIDYYGMREIV